MTLQLPNGYVDAGAAAMHDRGTWVNGFSESINGITYQGYAYGDIVHKASGVYMSLVDGNTTDPDTDTTSSWRTYLDKTDTSAIELSRCFGIMELGRRCQEHHCRRQYRTLPILQNVG